MQKKIPQRQCVACRGHFDKRSLGRIVRTPTGEIVFDTSGKVNGRGAYVCLNIECFKKAAKSGALQRALECKIEDSVVAMLEEAIRGNSGQ